MKTSVLKSIPLTSLQQELWLSHLSLPEKHPGISCGMKIVFKGVPEVSVLKKALGLLCKQFPLLSATFETVNEGKDLFPVIKVGVWEEPEFEYINLQEHPDPENTAERILNELIERPFHPIGGRLARFALIHISPQKSIFYSHYFHIIADGVATLFHFKVLCFLYNSLLKGEDKKIKLLPQDWQKDVDQDRHHLSSKRYEKDIDFWLKYCQNLPDESIFSPIYGKSGKLGIVENLKYELSPSVTKKIKEYVANTSVNLCNLFIALHTLTLGLLLEKERVVIQVPIRYGKIKNIWEVHGHRVNVVPLWVDINKNISFKNFVLDIEQKIWTFLKKSRTPFQKALRKNNLLSRYNHIWEAGFSCFNFKIDETLEDLEILSIDPIVSRFEPVIIDVYINALFKDKPLSLSFYYNPNYFTKKDMENYCRRLEQIAEDVLIFPEKEIKRISIILPEEEKKLSIWQKGKKVDYPRETIHSLFERVAQRHIKRPAVIKDGQVISYGELLKRVNGISSWLCELGIKYGDVVAVLARRHLYLPEVILGIMKLGAIYLPIDPDYPEERILYMINDAKAKEIVSLTTVDLLKYKELFPVRMLPMSLPSQNIEFSVSPNDPAYLIYTSGSTGKPKGVLVAHDGFVNMICSQIDIFGITSTDRILQFASPSFDASLSEIFMALMSGACLYPVDRDLIDNPWDLKKFMDENKISVVTFPPSYLRLFNKKSFSSLRIMITAGESPIYEDAKHYSKELEYFNAYGPTETSVCATIMKFDSEITNINKIGKPIPNTEAYVLNKDGYPVPPGRTGELCLGGRGVAIGYINREDLNKEKFVHPPFDPSKRIYRTGDLAFWDEDGNLILVGRVDDQVKVRGHRVELGEIRIALEKNDEVSKAEVIAITDTQGQKELVAFIVPKDAKNFNISLLRKKLLEKLPSFMVPARFFKIEKMPLGPTGKVNRKELLKIAQRKIEEKISSESSSDLKNINLKNKVCHIFEKVLKTKVHSIYTDLFTMGGDSLKVVELAYKLSNAFNCTISPREIFGNPTVEGVVKIIEKAIHSSDHKSSSKSDELLPLNQEQYQLLVLFQFNQDSVQYNMPLGVDFIYHGKAVSDFEKKLKSSILKAIKRQPLYNCVVEGDIDNPKFKRINDPNIVIDEVDVRNEKSPYEICEQLFNEYIHRPFDLKKSPPLRLLLIRLKDNIWRFLIVMHHIIGDNLSLEILLKDISNLLKGEKLSSVSIEHIIKFADKEKKYLNSEEYKNDILWWKNYLTPLPQRLNLVNASRSPIKGYKGGIINIKLSKDVSDYLLYLSKEANASLLTVFITLVFEFLSKETSLCDIAVGVPINLRDTEELQEIAGYFVNTIIIRKRFEKDSSLLEKIKKVSKDLYLAVQHGRVPFIQLYKTLEKKRDPSRLPLVDVLVTTIDERVLFNKANFPKDIDIRPVRVHLNVSKFDFVFILCITISGDMEVFLEYDSEIVPKKEAFDLLKRFEQFISELQEKKKIEMICAIESENIENILLRSWEKILGEKIISLNSNFFDLGGDSIKAIQIVGELRREGIYGIKPADIFLHPVFKDLLTFIKQSSLLGYETHEYKSFKKGDKLPLLPMQYWLIKKYPDYWHKFFMVILLKVKFSLDSEKFKEAVKELSLRHPVFQIKFTDKGEAFLNNSPVSAVYDEIYLKDNIDFKTRVQDLVRDLLKKIDPVNGSLIGVFLVRHGEKNFLIIGGHHLILDAISLDIIVKELLHFCKTGNWPDIKNTVSPFVWAKRLLDNKSLWEKEKEKWKKICSLFSPLKSISSGKDTPSCRITLTRKVNPLNRFRNTRTGVLAGLSYALYKIGENKPVLVALEGHGRENIFSDLDVSQTVGWFTVRYPMPIYPSPFIDQSVYEIEKFFKELRYGGVDYGVLSIFYSEFFNCVPQIGLNYVGSIYEENDFVFLPFLVNHFEIRELFHEDFTSDIPLEFFLYKTSSGELIIKAWFSPYRVDKKWVDSLLNYWEEALTQDITYSKEWKEISRICDCEPEDIKYVFDPLPQQEGMIYQYYLEGRESPTYSQEISFTLKGNIEPERLINAWQKVVDRHDALKSIFPVMSSGELKWVILKKDRNLHEYIDLSRLPSSSKKDEIAKRLQCTFVLDKGPLFYMVLVKLSENEFKMIWKFHHILLDGWCTSILLNDLFALYNNIEPPPAPSIQNYVLWYKDKEKDKETAIRFWKEYLKDVKSVTFVNPSNSVFDFSSSNIHKMVSEEFYIGERLASKISEVASYYKVSTSLLIQCIWAIVLFSLQKVASENVVFGLVTSGRSSEVESIESMVGMFIQTIPVKMRINLEENFGDFLIREQKNALKRMSFEYISLADIQKCSIIEGPLFDHILVFENYPRPEIPEDLSFKITDVSGQEQHPYNLGISIIYDHRITFRFSFYPEVIDKKYVLSLFETIKKVLEKIAEKKDISCFELIKNCREESSLFSLKSHYTWIFKINDTTRPYPKDVSINTLFLKGLDKYKDFPAIYDGTHQDKTLEISYSELNRISSLIGSALGPLEVGEPVAIAMKRGYKAIAAILGILKSGGCYMPLDMSNPIKRLKLMLEKSNCKKIIYDDFYSNISKFNGVKFYNFDELLNSGKDEDFNIERKGLDPAYIMFTSGTTGTPKGVMVPHKAVARLIFNNGFLKVHASDTILQAAPLGFDASTFEIWTALLNGAKLCIAPNELLLDPEKFKIFLREHSVSVMWLTTSLCNVLIEEDVSIFDSIKVLITGGEPLSVPHIKKLMEACPDLEVLNGYGPTENTVFTAVYRIKLEDLKGDSIPIGRPIGNTRVYIFKENGQIALPGEWGEIYAAGDGLALGYVGDDEENKRAFVELPPPFNERAYKTGDIGRWREDGVIEFKGRVDHQVKIRGYRIELAEIERAISKINGVFQNVVIACGKGDDRKLVAFVRGDQTLISEDKLRKELESVLPPYMIPSEIVFLDSFPINANGKIDRSALEERVTRFQEIRKTYADYKGIEETIVEIFSDVLKKPISLSQKDVDFFKLGGHSLKAMRLLVRLNSQFGIKLSLRDILSNSTVSSLSRKIKEVLKTKEPHKDNIEIEFIGERDYYPLSSSQERLWFLQCYKPDSAVYNIPFAIMLEGKVRLESLKKALLYVEKKHEALRLRVPKPSPNFSLQQKIAPPGSLKPQIYDFSHFDDPIKEVNKEIEKLVATPFSLGYENPLIKAFLFKIEPYKFVLLFIVHHIICDGISANIILNELREAYERYCKEEE